MICYLELKFFKCLLFNIKCLEILRPYSPKNLKWQSFAERENITHKKWYWIKCKGIFLASFGYWIINSFILWRKKEKLNSSLRVICKKQLTNKELLQDAQAFRQGCYRWGNDAHLSPRISCLIYCSSEH